MLFLVFLLVAAAAVVIMSAADVAAMTTVWEAAAAVPPLLIASGMATHSPSMARGNAFLGSSLQLLGHISDGLLIGCGSRLQV